MNYPSRVDPEALPNGWNQNPNSLALDTNNDSNGIANLREQRNHRIISEVPLETDVLANGPYTRPPSKQRQRANNATSTSSQIQFEKVCSEAVIDTLDGVPGLGSGASRSTPRATNNAHRISMGKAVIRKWAGNVARFRKFIGPGFMVAVAYIDPGNYATDVTAGASFRFKLLVMVLVSNFIAIFLQSLCIRLGSVTGLNLAENIRAHCPPWLNYTLWFFAEAAIVATDIAEARFLNMVIGTAIALNLLIHIPLVAGCAISIVDVLIILAFYRPSGSMRGLRVFEIGVALLVIGVVICFCFELSLISVPNVGEVFRGYLPSSALVESEGLYQACGILGATVMPHSLYLGSAIVQPRLMDFDKTHGSYLLRNHTNPSPPSPPDGEDDEESSNVDAPKYKPSLAAIRHCMSFSIAELALCLFTFALFVNSAILIVAGASLSNVAGATSATLFDVHDLLSRTLAPAAGTIFALALLLSGTSAGIVCTIAGQIVSEGQLNWSVKPWVRRLITRSISITPSIIIAGAVGKGGVSAALNGTQVALSVILPFTSAPLIYFTCRNKFMTVEDRGGSEGGVGAAVKMRNNWVVAGFAVALWLLVVIMNVALLVLVGKGQGA